MSGLLPFADGGRLCAPALFRETLFSALRSTFPPPSADRSLAKRDRSAYYPPVTFDREKMKRVAAELAANGVFVGTSSWKSVFICGLLSS